MMKVKAKCQKPLSWKNYKATFFMTKQRNPIAQNQSILKFLRVK